METRTYTNVLDRSEWPRGPWDHEPEDKVQWQDEVTGLPCLAVRHSYWANWCGYVGVPPGHQLYGDGYQNPDIYVHGGLTYSDRCQSVTDEQRGICHVPGEGEPHDVWWFGFDCGHYRDYSTLQAKRGEYETSDAQYRTLDYVKNQCANLARQLSEEESNQCPE